MRTKKKPSISFINNVAKRWWWLVGSVIGGVQVVLAVLNITPLGSWLIGGLIFVVCLIIAMYLAYRDLYIKVIVEKPSIEVRGQKRNIREDMVTILNLNGQMVKIHGHEDYFGIESDARDGVPWNNILNNKCTICGKPRNEQGD